MHFPATLAAIAALAASGAGHSLLSNPPSRGNVKWWGTCAAGAGCKGPCDSPKADSPFNSIYNPKKYIERGQELDVGWSRLNHPGGFVRLAMVPFNQSDSWSAFNDNVLKYTCYETNCGPKDANDKTFGYLNGPGSAPCSTTVTVPKNIPDNTAVTLQWIWYGGGIYYGQPDTSFGEYYSCSDLIVVGGPYSDEKPEATFKGGDVSNPNSNTCKYWGSNKVGDCNFGDRSPNPVEGDLLSQSLEPCMRGPETRGVPYGFDSSSPSYSAPASSTGTSPVAHSPESSTNQAPYSSPAAPVADQQASPSPAAEAAPSSEAAPAAPVPAPAPPAEEPASNDSIPVAPAVPAAPAPDHADVDARKCIPRPVYSF